MLRIRRKHRLTKVCSFEVVVFITFHVADPYNNTDFTLLRKMRSLVLVDIDVQSGITPLTQPEIEPRSPG
jgi:hypothetical protein